MAYQQRYRWKMETTVGTTVTVETTTTATVEMGATVGTTATGTHLV